MARKPVRTAELPSKAELLRFINESPGRVGKREIARAFHLSGSDRIALKAMLKELAEEGLIERGRHRRFAAPGALPPVAVIEITGVDEDGVLSARPVGWRDDLPPPAIAVPPDRRWGPALGPGERALARLTRVGEGYEARIMRRLPHSDTRVVGVFTEVAGSHRIVPTDRKQKFDFVVPRGETGGATKGELVLANVVPGRRLGLREAHVVERLGRIGDTRSLSLIAIHTHEIPDVFPAEAVAEARAAKPVRLGERTDLRDLPLVTIDGEDARDFDDAVWAEPDDAANNPGGWKVVVAIADVGHYVRPGSALDGEALKRGNSVYFPDYVVPMLPEELSNDLCSLRPRENRASIAVAMRFDRHGRKLDHRFMRALIRSAARLTYTQVQATADGYPDDVTGPLMDSVIEPLYGAYRALVVARTRRQPLDLDLPEMRVIFDENGEVAAVRRRERFDSHRLIEEFMIAANVCAAETLERARMPCMYRIHDEPDREKVRALREFLQTLGYKLPAGEVMKPALFNRVLAKAAGTPQEEAVNQAVLRAQAQAVYSPDNIGHFGLNLRRYAHFTSPIRRYSDLLVHRALIRGLGLGAGGLSDDEAARFEAIGTHISNTERRAMLAERDAMDRFVAVYMAAHVGAEFTGLITGVTRAGLFVTLHDTGANGLAPISTLGADYFRYDEAQRALIGERSRRRFRLGDRVTVRLKEADPITGGMIVAVVGEDAEEGAARGGAPGRGRASAEDRPRGQEKVRGGRRRRR